MAYVSDMLDIIVEDFGCSKCDVEAGRSCTEKRGDRVLRACDARQHDFRWQGSQKARLEAERLQTGFQATEHPRLGLQPWYIRDDETHLL